MRKPTLVLCNSGVAVEQWRAQLKQWSTLPESHVLRFTPKTRDRYSEELTEVVISTYNMIAMSGPRSKASQHLLSRISSRVWGLLLLDEAHIVPADMFRKVLSLTRFRAALGLTATLVREDAKIADLDFLVGPRLYQANWWELVQGGSLARVECCEVRCPMTKEFFQNYLTSKLPFQRRLLALMNPNKLQACHYIVQHHEAKGDKTLVFSDDLFALSTYARAVGRPLLCGATSVRERLRLLAEFRHSVAHNTLFISRVGDQAIDLPEASVIVQISSHFGSR
eukprot:RCo000386